jgi:uncharacterized cupin superfamily protein
MSFKPLFRVTDSPDSQSPRTDTYKADVNYTEDEFCYILEGRVRLTDAAGKVEEYKAGDAFMIPAGFKGTWETVEAVKKFYVIHTPKGGA